MTSRETQIIRILDNCCEAFTFPMLDNGYVYLAASRMTLYRSDLDWALVMEVFGFNPRAGRPYVSVSTFANRLVNRDSRESYVNENAYAAYLKNHPNDESRFYYPIEEGPWQDAENGEMVSAGARDLVLRGETVAIPSPEELARLEIHCDSLEQLSVFVLCRALAANHRELVLATPEEKRANVVSDLPEILTLDEWNHPDLAAGVKASESETFRQIANVLVTGDRSQYRPTLPGNTHWRNWPDGGEL